jgi:cytoskeleton protein RodZ
MRPLQLPERADVEQATADQTTADQTSIEPVVAESINAGVAVTANSVQQGRAATAPAVNVERAVSAAATSSVATAGEVASENVEASAIDVTIEKRGDGQGSRITVTAVGEDKLEFDFSGECWVEITDADGESIYGDLNRAGDSLVVFGTAPFEVLFGKASAAKLQFNGKSFALSRYTSLDQTARVKLGR